MNKRLPPHCPGLTLILALTLPLTLALLAACATDRPFAGGAALSQSEPSWIFRHKVRIAFPDRKMTQSFDGAMRFDRAERRIQVIGLGGFGLRLFDLLVEPELMEVRALHPGLEALPHAAEHIAATVRHIWFDCLDRMPPSFSGESPQWRCAASEEQLQGWPLTLSCENRVYGYTVTVHLLQAARENKE
jgi:hypothetical protein